MRRLPTLALLLALTLPGTAVAGDGDARERTGLRPATFGRAAGLLPATTGRAASLPAVTRDRAVLPSATRGRKAGLRPVTRGREASLAPVTVDRAAGSAPISLDRAAERAPVTSDRAAGLAPVTTGRAAGPAAIGLGREAGLRPVTRGRAAELSPVSIDRAALLRAVGYDGAEAGVVVFRDGWLAPWGSEDVPGPDFLAATLRENREGFARAGARRVRDAFRRAGHREPVVLDGTVRAALGLLDAPAPRVIGSGRFTVHAGYYLNPRVPGDRAYNKERGTIVVPTHVKETIPDDFHRKLRKTSFPLVVGDVAFKAGNYVQASIAFRDAADRRPDAAAGHFALGDALVALENYGYAAAEIRAGLAIAPGWGHGLDRHGLYGVEGDAERHLRAVEAHVADRPSHAAGWFVLGWLRMTSGDEELRAKAAPAFREALARNPEDRAAVRLLRALEN